jgi:ADP-heptose:LPS heptosyltransferase
MKNAASLEASLGGPAPRIVVFRALVLGDMLCMIPAMRALRRALPEAHIALVCLPWAGELVDRFPHYFDDFIPFPGFPGLPEREFDVAGFPRFLQRVQSEKFDLALQLHGSGSFVNPLVAMFGARRSAGFTLPGEYTPDSEFFIEYPDDIPEVWRHLRVMEHLGIAPAGAELELPVTEADRAELASIPRAEDLLESPYVCIHPGARYLSRRWMPERFARVADLLASEGYRMVITGAASELPLAAAVSEAMTHEHLNVAGKTSLGSLTALVAGARLLICNDTGVSHVAAAVKTQSVVIVTGSDPSRWAPLDRERHQLVMQPVECRPCEHRVCPIDFRCAERVTVAEVAAKALEMLARGSELSVPPLAKGA